MNGKAAQVNPTATEPFQAQNKNTIKVKDNNYGNIMMNQIQGEKYLDGEIQHHQDEENRSINAIENQLVEFCQKQPKMVTQVKNPCILEFQRGIEKLKLNTSQGQHLMACMIISTYQIILKILKTQHVSTTF